MENSQISEKDIQDGALGEPPVDAVALRPVRPLTAVLLGDADRALDRGRRLDADGRQEDGQAQEDPQASPTARGSMIHG